MTSSPPEPGGVGESDNMLAIRSGIPLAWQQRSRQRRKSINNQTSVISKRISKAGGKGDLGVRKDLIQATIATAKQDNVFQVITLTGSGLPNK